MRAINADQRTAGTLQAAELLVGAVLPGNVAKL